MTKRQIAFIRKAWEDREVRKTSLVNLAINNAMTNMHRKKGKPPVPLFKKHTEQVSVEVLKDSVKRVEDIEKRKGKGWVQKLWAANRKR